MNKLLILFTFVITQLSYAENYIDEHVKKLNWNGIDVIWLEDNTLPVYDLSIYFGEGALGDPKGMAGTTELMFSQLTSGTTRYSQKQILESLEYYGASYGSSTVHEYSTFGVSGLVKDYIPTMKMVCHLFNQATFPVVELKKVKRRIKSSIESIVTNHRSLANHIFRYESLKGSGYETPVSGTLKSIKKIQAKDLAKRLNHHNKNVQKRIYIKGPKSILGLKNIFINDCGWKQTPNVVKLPEVKKRANNKKVVFVRMPKANQAQVRVGRVLLSNEINGKNSEKMTFAAKFLGGGFTSELVQELRVKKGLTYSAGAYASEQKMYGRSGISTFTRDDKIVEMLNGIQEVIKLSSALIKERRLQEAKRNIKGNYLLALESTSEFLKNLMFHDHIGKEYSQIYKFQDKIDQISNEDLRNIIDEVYGWDKQTVLILGSKTVEKNLEKAGYKINKVNYKDYL